MQSRAAEQTAFLLCSSLRHRVKNQVKELAAADWPIARLDLRELIPLMNEKTACAPQQSLLQAVASLLHRCVLPYLETGLQALAIAVLASAAFSIAL